MYVCMSSILALVYMYTIVSLLFHSVRVHLDFLEDPVGLDQSDHKYVPSIIATYTYMYTGQI